MNSEDSNKISTSVFWPQTAISWLELILKVILITASLSAVYQYFDVKQENRVKKTMEFLDHFSSGQLQDAQMKLSASWSDYHDDIKQLNQIPVKSEKDKALIIENMVLQVVLHREQSKDIDLLVIFFENLQICIDNRICDQRVSQSFFGEYASGFFSLYQPWIKERRKLIPNYACQLQAFVQQTNC